MTGETDTIRVMLADGQASFREALRTFLEPERDVAIVGEASDAQCIPSLTSRLRPDVLLIDVAFFHGLHCRAEELTGVRTLVTVPAPARTDIIRVFLQGARGMVPKKSAPHVWTESIRAVVAGRYWLEGESIAILVELLREHLSRWNEVRPSKEYGLTPREMEIIEKIADGHSNKQVGQAFSIREKTVKRHLTNIFPKVGASSRLELALFALNHRLLETARPRDAASPDGHDSPPPARHGE
jgi:two-component system, NarL family, nitrate/nitrite response regulator NarL